jgi:hypothetical protein
MARLNKRLRMSAIFAAMLLAGATGCGSDAGGAGSGGSGGSGQKVTINEPADGSSISIPFTLRLDSSVELGSTESGKHHVHLYFDGDDSKYEVIESETVKITDASPAVAGLKAGEHKLNISLRNADHSAAGFDTSITVRTGSGGGGGQPSDDGGTGGGY